MWVSADICLSLLSSLSGPLTTAAAVGGLCSLRLAMQLQFTIVRLGVSVHDKACTHQVHCQKSGNVLGS